MAVAILAALLSEVRALILAARQTVALGVNSGADQPLGGPAGIAATTAACD